MTIQPYEVNTKATRRFVPGVRITTKMNLAEPLRLGIYHSTNESALIEGMKNFSGFQ
uniref:hypothetical protein n=1 Tax=Brasilonema sp. UFV-L1 TaxID=2234130 RepID=UPI0030DAC3CE